ncbi:hypothetical protein HK098_005193 [Nowakowskiella sp. JEL0407]|nr:hypothetical protein HK098_005193 [Nowakowskiella sp. JEL0407]
MTKTQVFFFGDLPEVPVGTVFDSRKELKDAGVHGMLHRGIHGSEKLGCYSVVVNDGYGNVDQNHSIIYVGEGGKDYKGNFSRSNAVVSQDQEMKRGNLALIQSFSRKKGVRVIRGSGTQYGPPKGYRYDGIYFVNSYEFVPAHHGFKVFKFYLTRDVSGSNRFLTNQPVAKAIVQKSETKKIKDSNASGRIGSEIKVTTTAEIGSSGLENSKPSNHSIAKVKSEPSGAINAKPEYGTTTIATSSNAESHSRFARRNALDAKIKRQPTATKIKKERV